MAVCWSASSGEPAPSPRFHSGSSPAASSRRAAAVQGTSWVSTRPVLARPGSPDSALHGQTEAAIPVGTSIAPVNRVSPRSIATSPHSSSTTRQGTGGNSRFHTAAPSAAAPNSSTGVAKIAAVSGTGTGKGTGGGRKLGRRTSAPTSTARGLGWRRRARPGGRSDEADGDGGRQRHGGGEAEGGARAPVVQQLAGNQGRGKREGSRAPVGGCRVRRG